MKDKTIDCLKLCSMPYGRERDKFQEEICAKYSTKAVRAKLEELKRKGYIKSGLSVFGAWLTEKGKATLHNLTA